MTTRAAGWWEQANCLGLDTDSFYPEQGEPNGTAKRVCARCPVQAQCLEHALATDERYGIWGGTSEHERRTFEKKAA